MSIIDLISNRYVFTARLQPALLGLIQIPIAAVIMFPDIEKSYSLLVALFSYFGGTIFLSNIAREYGKVAEEKLYALWGGMPSVALLRHSDTVLNTHTKERYHLYLSSPPRLLPMPTAHEEQQNFYMADQKYSAASDWLRENTRDKTAFPVIYEELITYGFRRNFFGLKPTIYLINASLIGAYLYQFYLTWQDSFSKTLDVLGHRFEASLAVVVLHLLITHVVVTSDWVRKSAIEYAKQLLAACNRP